MLSKREGSEPKPATLKMMRLAPLVALAATLVGVFAYVATDSSADQGPLDNRPDIASNAAPDIASHATIRPWSDYLPEGAVDSGGIENDLDGNASALVPSDCIGLSACGIRLQP